MWNKIELGKIMTEFINKKDAINTIKAIDTNIIPFAKAKEYVDECIVIINKRLEELPSIQTEATAKVKKQFMLVTGGMGGTLFVCECNQILKKEWKYCPLCGKRLEWE